MSNNQDPQDPHELQITRWFNDNEIDFDEFNNWTVKRLIATAIYAYQEGVIAGIMHATIEPERKK
jgi:hypothetical protein